MIGHAITRFDCVVSFCFRPFRVLFEPTKIQPKSANRSNLQECHCWLLPQVTLSKVTQDESRSPLLDLSRLSSDPGRGAKHGGEKSR